MHDYASILHMGAATMKFPNLTLERYIAALKRIRALIASGLPLDYDDDTTTGSKHMYCTWGLCSDTKDAWPDPQDYIWPDQPWRVAPKNRETNHTCPFRQAAPSINGCFWSCMIFKAKKHGLPTREQALALYDAKIKEAESWQQ